PLPRHEYAGPAAEFRTRWSTPSRIWVPPSGWDTTLPITLLASRKGEEIQYPWTSTTFNVEGPTWPASPVTAPSGRRTGPRPSTKLAGSISRFSMGRPIGSTPFAAGSGLAIWSLIPTGSPKLCSVRESSTPRIRLGRSAQSASPSFAEVLDGRCDVDTRAVGRSRKSQAIQPTRLEFLR